MAGLPALVGPPAGQGKPAHSDERVSARISSRPVFCRRSVVKVEGCCHVTDFLDKAKGARDAFEAGVLVDGRRSVGEPSDKLGGATCGVLWPTGWRAGPPSPSPVGVRNGGASNARTLRIRRRR